MTDSPFNPEKLVAIAFRKYGAVPRHLEDTLLYSLLTALSLYTPMKCRDMASTADRIELSPDLPDDQVYQKYTQICQSTRSRYLLTGSLHPSSEAGVLQSVAVQLQVYDAEGKRFTAEITEQLDGFTKDDNQELIPRIAAFNSLLQRTVTQLLEELSPELAGRNIPQLSQSYQALMLLMRAQREDNPTEKITFCEHALLLDPTLEPAFAQLARIYRAEEKYEQSVLYYRKTLENSHASHAVKAQYATDAGICLAVLGKYDLALQWWQRAIQYQPDLINPYFNIANVYEDRGEFEQAEEYFCKAQGIAPDDFRTHFNLARIYAKLGSWSKALVQYQYQLKTDENDPWIHSDIANVYLHLGELDNAKKHLEKTVQLDPEGEAGQFARLILEGMG